MNILHVHTKGRKLDTLEQLEIYKHTKTHKNDILNEQSQFKSQDVYKRQLLELLLLSLFYTWLVF